MWKFFLVATAKESDRRELKKFSSGAGKNPFLLLKNTKISFMKRCWKFMFFVHISCLSFSPFLFSSFFERLHNIVHAYGMHSLALAASSMIFFFHTFFGVFVIVSFIFFVVYSFMPSTQLPRLIKCWMNFAATMISSERVMSFYSSLNWKESNFFFISFQAIKFSASIDYKKKEFSLITWKWKVEWIKIKFLRSGGNFLLNFNANFAQPIGFGGIIFQRISAKIIIFNACWNSCRANYLP